MLAPSGLSKLEREMIAVAVSSVNRCYYCPPRSSTAPRSARRRNRASPGAAATGRRHGSSSPSFNMSNRMASAVDMRPNRSYHGDVRTLPDLPEP
jgi:alkylhydroperoxidase family enzyme